MYKNGRDLLWLRAAVNSGGGAAWGVFVTVTVCVTVTITVSLTITVMATVRACV